MKSIPCVLSTKKLPANKVNYLLNVPLQYMEADFIAIRFIPFTIQKSYTFNLFTSQNAVKAVAKHHQFGEIVQKPAVCVGSKTAQSLEALGFKVKVVADYAEQLAPIIQNNFSKEKFAFFCGNLRRDVLPDMFMRNQIAFTEYLVYETQHQSKELDSAYDGILFFSPSAVESFLQHNSVADKNCFCIGHTTAQAIPTLAKNIIVAQKPTIDNTIIQTIKFYKSII